MNARVYRLDDYRKTPAVELTRSQETRLRLGHNIVEALHEERINQKIDRLDREIQEHIIEMGFGDLIA